MSSTTLQLEDYTRLQQNGNSGYVLPELVLAAIQQLCAEIGYDESVANDLLAKADSGASSFKPKDREYRAHPKAKQDNWKSKPEKVSNFKVSKFAVLDDVSEIINEIRIAMNKLNQSNKEGKIPEIMAKIQQLIDDSEADVRDENVNKVFSIIYDISMSNDKMADLYASLLSTIYATYHESFCAFIATQLEKYRESFYNIVDVDPNQDYDGFCALMTKTNSRKKATLVFCEIAKLNKIEIINTHVLEDIVDKLVAHVVESISTKERQKEIEEITESLVLYLGNMESAAALKTKHLETFVAISGYKTSEKPGLNSRTKFKYMDLIGK
jgi:hypothetical protein